MKKKTKNMFISGTILFVSAASLIADTSMDIEKIKNGDVKEFSSKNHPKAQGLEILIKYPSDWKNKEGQGPKTIQQIYNLNGKPRIINIYARDLRESIKKIIKQKELSDFLSDAEIENTLSTFSVDDLNTFTDDFPDLEVIKKESININGNKCFRIISFCPSEKHALKKAVYCHLYFVILKTKLVTFYFEKYCDNEKISLLNLEDEKQANILFDKIAQSIDLKVQ